MLPVPASLCRCGGCWGWPATAAGMERVGQFLSPVVKMVHGFRTNPSNSQGVSGRYQPRSLHIHLASSLLSTLSFSSLTSTMAGRTLLYFPIVPNASSRTDRTGVWWHTPTAHTLDPSSFLCHFPSFPLPLPTFSVYLLSSIFFFPPSVSPLSFSPPSSPFPLPVLLPLSD